MKLIGMLGGMSWESTAEYYRLANELVRERLGGLASARVLLHSVDFAQVEQMQAVGDWEAAGRLLAAAAVGLEAGGADLIVLCTNTMHKVSGVIEAATSIPFIHIGDVTALAARSAGLSTVGLLATAYTMEQDFLRGRLAEHGLRVLIPDVTDRAEIHRIIYEELCLGVLREESRAIYRSAIGRLVEDGAEGIILGCTEIELLIGPADATVPILPTTRLHVEAAVAAALQETSLT